MGSKSIVHIDLNAFFAQCEENRDPSLKGKPVAVGGDHRRGIVATANYEARKYGVHSAMPSFQAKKLCPQIVFIPGNYALYSKVSRNFMQYLRSRFPLIEPVSIDECYLDLTDKIDNANAHDFLADLQLKIYFDLSLKCSIGYGHTKFLAKMASDFKKPMGLTLILNDEYKELFWPLSIDKMWGVGKKTAPYLKQLGILTIGDLAQTDSKDVKNLLGSGFSTFWDWANGRGNDVVDTSDWDRKSISSSLTLLDDTDDVSTLKDVLRGLSKDVSDELKKEKKLATNIVLTIRDENFKTRSKRGQPFKETDDEEEIYLAAIDIFLDFYKGEKVRLLGVGAESTLSAKEPLQLRLFDQSPLQEEEDEKESAKILEKLNTGKTSGLFTTLGAKKGKGK